MPDHFHALLTATSEQADFCELVRRFKQVSAFNYRKSKGRALWQPGYHERILRDDEVTEAVVRYILKNPIRAGLTQGLGEYRFAGSEVYDLAGLMTAWANGNHGVKSGSRPKGLHYKYKKLTTKTRKREKDVRRGGPEGPHYEKGRT
jgi:hypothetical protein